MRVVVCGTNYGSSYLDALHPEWTLAGLLSRGSARSQTLASQLRVPLFTNVTDVPEVGAAIVAVPGEAGRAITHAFLSRGVHVLAEHPVVADDIRAYRAYGPVYHVNAHWSDIEPASAFVSAFRGTRARSRLLFVSMHTNRRALFATTELLARALGTVAPFAVTRHPGAFFDIVQLDAAGVPVTVQIQREVSAVDDGSSMWVSHNILAGFEAGNLALAEASGPVAWMPATPTIAELNSPRGAEHFARPVWRMLAPPAPAYGDFAIHQRQRANRAALARFAGEIHTSVAPPEQTTEHLTSVAELWARLI